MNFNHCQATLFPDVVHGYLIFRLMSFLLALHFSHIPEATCMHYCEQCLSLLSGLCMRYMALVYFLLHAFRPRLKLKQ
eukprot:c23670_g2_i2 orf=722-955(-)